MEVEVAVKGSRAILKRRKMVVLEYRYRRITPSNTTNTPRQTRGSGEASLHLETGRLNFANHKHPTTSQSAEWHKQTQPPPIQATYITLLHLPWQSDPFFMKERN